VPIKFILVLRADVTDKPDSCCRTAILADGMSFPTSDPFTIKFHCRISYRSGYMDAVFMLTDHKTVYQQLEQRRALEQIAAKIELLDACRAAYLSSLPWLSVDVVPQFTLVANC
jgi:hypothetical protein